MTKEEIEITFVTTTKDWTRVRSLLDGLALRHHNMLFYVVAHKGTAGAVHAAKLGVCIFAVVHFLPKLLAKGVDQFLSVSTILTLAFVAWALWSLGQSLWQVVAKTLAPEESARTGCEGVHWGKHQLLATPESLSVRLSARHTVYSWSAFLGLKKTKNLLLLQLTPCSAVAVPRQAFGSKADETIFCDFVQKQACL